MQVKPIRTKADYAQALKRIEQLRGAKAGTPKGDLFDILVALVESYELRHFPDLPDPVEAIQFKLDQMGQDESSLVGIVGHRTRVYEIMRRHRPLSLRMIRNVHQKLQIPAEVLIRPGRTRYKTVSSPRARAKRKSS